VRSAPAIPARISTTLFARISFPPRTKQTLDAISGDLELMRRLDELLARPSLARLQMGAAVTQPRATEFS